MDEQRKFDIKYDYSLAILMSETTETLIGGAEKAVKKVIKKKDEPNLSVKGLDFYYRDKPLGTLLSCLNPDVDAAEEIQELADKLYANLQSKNTSSLNVAETRNDLETKFIRSKNIAVRIIAKTVNEWYNAVIDLYMNGGFLNIMPLSRQDRAEMGEQFNDEVYAFIEKMFSAIKKKNPPSDTEDIDSVFGCPTLKIEEFLQKYIRYLSAHKIYPIQCRLCGNYFVSNAQNTLYCDNCKAIRTQNSKDKLKSKETSDYRNDRQKLRHHMEYVIYKSKRFKELSPELKEEYQKLHDDFVKDSTDLLTKYEKKGGKKAGWDLHELIEKAENDEKAFCNKYLK